MYLRKAFLELIKRRSKVRQNNMSPEGTKLWSFKKIFQKLLVNYSFVDKIT